MAQQEILGLVTWDEFEQIDAIPTIINSTPLALAVMRSPEGYLALQSNCQLPEAEDNLAIPITPNRKAYVSDKNGSTQTRVIPSLTNVHANELYNAKPYAAIDVNLDQQSLTVTTSGTMEWQPGLRAKVVIADQVGVLSGRLIIHSVVDRRTLIYFDLNHEGQPETVITPDLDFTRKLGLPDIEPYYLRRHNETPAQAEATAQLAFAAITTQLRDQEVRGIDMRQSALNFYERMDTPNLDPISALKFVE